MFPNFSIKIYELELELFTTNHNQEDGKKVDKHLLDDTYNTMLQISMKLAISIRQC